MIRAEQHDNAVRVPEGIGAENDALIMTEGHTQSVSVTSAKSELRFRGMSLLTDHEVEVFLDAHPGWKRTGKAISRTFEFGGFSEAIGFVTRIALLAEKADHHPDIDIRWNKVTLAVVTHSEGGLTGRDVELADTADRLA